MKLRWTFVLVVALVCSMFALESDPNLEPRDAGAVVGLWNPDDIGGDLLGAERDQPGENGVRGDHVLAGLVDAFAEPHADDAAEVQILRHPYASAEGCDAGGVLMAVDVSASDAEVFEAGLITNAGGTLVIVPAVMLRSEGEVNPGGVG